MALYKGSTRISPIKVIKPEGGSDFSFTIEPAEDADYYWVFILEDPDDFEAFEETILDEDYITPRTFESLGEAFLYLGSNLFTISEQGGGS